MPDPTLKRLTETVEEFREDLAEVSEEYRLRHLLDLEASLRGNPLVADAFGRILADECRRAVEKEREELATDQRLRASRTRWDFSLRRAAVLAASGCIVFCLSGDVMTHRSAPRTKSEEPVHASPTPKLPPVLDRTPPLRTRAERLAESLLEGFRVHQLRVAFKTSPPRSQEVNRLAAQIIAAGTRGSSLESAVSATSRIRILGNSSDVEGAGEWILEAMDHPARSVRLLAVTWYRVVNPEWANSPEICDRILAVESELLQRDTNPDR